MLSHTFDAGVVLAWATGDSVYGDDRVLRSWMEGRKQAYLLAISSTETIWINHEQQQPHYADAGRASRSKPVVCNAAHASHRPRSGSTHV
jgi:hypothetical protein